MTPSPMLYLLVTNFDFDMCLVVCRTWNDLIDAAARTFELSERQDGSTLESAIQAATEDSDS